MTRHRPALLPTLLAVLALTAACKQGSAPAGPERHPLKGKVVAVDRAERKLTIAHQDIPGFMPAMTMDFVVLEKDAALLAGVSPGDEVEATLVVPDSRYWIEDLVVVKKGTPEPARAPSPRARVADPGDPLPDVALVDQDGHAFHLADFRGKALALTFVFTRCPLPDFCPLMMKRFAAAHAALVSDAALGDRTHLLTVSFDTKHDTPDVLRSYGRPFQKTRPPFTQWTLASGKEEAIRRLGAALELDFVEENRTFTHNLRTAVIGPDGRLVRLFRGNDWQPEELVSELRSAAGD